MTMTLPNDEVVIPTPSRAQRMRAARETTGLTQEDFANQIGLNRRTVARWEREEGPAPKSVLLLVQMRTKVPTEWLLTGKYTPRDLNPEPTVSTLVGARRGIGHLRVVEDQDAAA